MAGFFSAEAADDDDDDDDVAADVEVAVKVVCAAFAFAAVGGTSATLSTEMLVFVIDDVGDVELDCRGEAFKAVGDAIFVGATALSTTIAAAVAAETAAAVVTLWPRFDGALSVPVSAAGASTNSGADWTRASGEKLFEKKKKKKKKRERV